MPILGASRKKVQMFIFAYDVHHVGQARYFNNPLCFICKTQRVLHSIRNVALVNNAEPFWVCTRRVVFSLVSLRILPKHLLSKEKKSCR